MSAINEVVMVSACRTPIGDFLGSLKSVRANELSAITASEAINRAGIEARMIDEIVMGMCLHHGNGSLPPRQVAMAVGMDPRSGSTMLSQNCASGMRAVEVAANSLALGKTEIALVVGTESMSNIPYILQQGRSGFRMGDSKAQDAMLSDGLICALAGGHMGLTAENVAEKYGITRAECDELAVLSHNRAAQAIFEGRFKREIVPVNIKTKKGTTSFENDEHPISGANMEAMAKLPAAFKKEGVVTAANASGINDGSAAAVFMTKQKAQELGIKPLMKLINVCTEGVEAKVMGLGPAVAIPKCLKQAEMAYDEVEYWEINEAFAAQFIGVDRMIGKEFGLKIDLDKTNHNGSGIALGHPVGCTALRIIVSLYYEMERLNLTVGGASLCVGGGSAMASLWTRDI